MAIPRPFKRDVLEEALLPVMIFLVNGFLVYPLFTGEYTQLVGSIESAFIADARFIDQNGFTNWNPLWYCGFPFHLFYTPLVPGLMVVIHRLIPSISIPQSYRLLTALAYALGPVTLYLFVKYLTRRRLSALTTATIYSVALTYVYTSLTFEATLDFKLIPYTLAMLKYFGEGPHILGLTIIPLAALTLLRSLRTPSFKQYVLTSVTIAAVALTNLIAFYAFGLIAVLILISEASKGDARRKIRTGLICGILTYGLIAFCYDLSFLKASIDFGVFGEDTLTWKNFVLMTAIFAAVLVILHTRFSKKPESQQLFIACSWTAIFLIIAVSGDLFKMPLAPQPSRYVPEFNIGFSILLGIAVTPVFDQSVKALQRRRKAKWTKLVFATIGIMVLTLPLTKSTWNLTDPNDNIETTPEYKLAKWLEANTDGERAYATGTIGFWLNVFTDVPQLRGGSDQASTNRWWRDATTELHWGSDGNLSGLWLKVLSIKYVVNIYPTADTPYHDYVFPGKFEGLFPLRYEYGGFRIFEIPQSHPELIQPVNVTRPQDLQIEGSSDVEGMAMYVDAVERALPVRSSYKFIGADRVIVNVSQASEYTGILVKMTFDERWKAYVNGVDVAITEVGPSFMLINPEKAGNYKLELICRKTASEVIGITISAFTLTSLSAICITNLRKRREKLHR